MREKERDPAGIFDRFGDDLSRRILVLASGRPFSADDLASTFETSHPTVYRRLDALLDHNLLREQQELDTGGNQYKTLETTLERISFEIDDGGYTIDMQMRRDLVEQFTDFWSDLIGSSIGEPSPNRDDTNHTDRNRDTDYG